MSFETALRARLKADPVIEAVGASVEWARRPEGFDRPAIILTTAYSPRNRTMMGRQGFIPARLYFDIMTLDAPLKVALRGAVLAIIGFRDVRAGIRFWPARNISVTDLSEQFDTQFIHRDQIDAILPYKET